jgi:DNA-directed RNA polymerase subunit RPC12/RpoP
MNQKSTNPTCFICGREITQQVSANKTPDPKQSICKECEERIFVSVKFAGIR